MFKTLCPSFYLETGNRMSTWFYLGILETESIRVFLDATEFFRHPETEQIQIFLDVLEMGQIQMCLEKVELFWRLWEQTFEVKIE